MPAGVLIGEDGVSRCWWGGRDPVYVPYHDGEWGFPVADDRRLFEKICLEGFQAGLSWLTILRKREAFRRAFAGFELEKVARFGGRRRARREAPHRSRDRPPPGQDRVGDPQRAARARGRRRGRVARGPRLALRAAAEGPTAEAHARGARASHGDRGVAGALEGAPPPRLH